MKFLGVESTEQRRVSGADGEPDVALTVTVKTKLMNDLTDCGKLIAKRAATKTNE